MKIFQNLSIKYKLIVFVLIVTLLAIGIGGTLVIFNNIDSFKKDMVSTTETIAKYAADACAPSFEFMQTDELKGELDKLKGLPDIESGFIYDSDGILIEEQYRKEGVKYNPPDKPEPTSSKFEKGYLHTFYPVPAVEPKDPPVGTLFLRTSTAALDKKIRKYLWTMSIGLVFLVVFTYFLAARFQRVISGPILKLSRVTEDITREADYSVRVHKGGDDEIGTLYNGFNNMLEQIQVREKQRNAAEDEQKRLMVELEEKNKELEQVLYVTSHDLRSPLVNIQGFSKELGYSLEDLSALLNIDSIPSETKEKFAMIVEEDIPDSLKYILSSTTKMDTLLSGLLKLSRVGRTASTFGTVDMNELFTEINNAFEFQIKEGGIKFTQEEVSDCYGNDVQLNQLFSNLVNNALKYLDPERSGILSVRGYKEGDRRVYVVSDNGVGIQKDHQKKVFEIFHRLNPSETAGEGLGLSIVNKIVSRHSGRIWVESEYGVGSTFYVALQAPKDSADN
ncbi:MAG: HAMP domain-containing histidine kinase [bacterium]|nr:HAMP domain-containing histidine kinase [bacterium]